MPNTTNQADMSWHQKLHIENLEKVSAAVKKLKSKGNDVTHVAVARLSGISRTTLYENSDMNDLIMQAKYGNEGTKPNPDKNADAANLRFQCSTLEKKIKEQDLEKAEIKKVLEKQNGQIYLMEKEIERYKGLLRQHGIQF